MAADTKDMNDEKAVKASAEETTAAAEGDIANAVKAKEALSSTTGGEGEKTYSFVQLAGSTQVTSKLHTRADLAGIEVVTLVKRLAKKEHSVALAQLACRISAVMRFGSSAGEDPFAKVRALISDMISKLEAEAGSESIGRSAAGEPRRSPLRATSTAKWSPSRRSSTLTTATTAG